MSLRAAAFVALGLAVSAVATSAQGRCMLKLGDPACVTTAVTPVFASTGWKTVALDHITIGVADYKKEAAFYAALMGWTLRSDDGKRAVMDYGTEGTVIFRQMDMPAAPTAPAPVAGAGRGGRGGAPRAVVESFAFVIDKWNAGTVEAELKKRGLTPVADNDGTGFESFHVKDPDGFDLQISNGNGFVKARKTQANNTVDMPFESTGWKTVWLDHLSFGAGDYKKSASFYENLLGWTGTYDEGSQNEMFMGDTGNIIIRGGNSLAPATAAQADRSGRIDHISFGIEPWDTDGVKAELEKRKLTATIDTSSRHLDETGKWVPDDIHTAEFKSYHTTTPNGYNLQISYVTKDKRTKLSNAVRPRKTGGL